jgi:hypothetical protein
MRVFVLVHFALAECFDWSIGSTLVIEYNKLVQDGQQDLVFHWSKTARAARHAFLGRLQTIHAHQILA